MDPLIFPHVDMSYHAFTMTPVYDMLYDVYFDIVVCTTCGVIYHVDDIALLEVMSTHETLPHVVAVHGVPLELG